MQTILPRWTRTISDLKMTNAVVRCHCHTCEIVLRADIEALEAKLGPAATLIDRRDRCMVVGCSGTMTYRAATTYGRQFIELLTAPPLQSEIAPAA